MSSRSVDEIPAIIMIAGIFVVSGVCSSLFGVVDGSGSWAGSAVIIGNLSQPGHQPGQFMSSSVRLIAELVKDGRDRRRRDGRHRLPQGSLDSTPA
ncbi:hypothetical protein AMK15_24975 [Streptomyces sp. MJM1172]|nr:hypothetical protein AMK15_24975 [Streptomyces sp. MJM1172]